VRNARLSARFRYLTLDPSPRLRELRERIPVPAVPRWTSGTPRATLTPAETDQLALYNAERARGIQHTPEWHAKMAQLQRRFDDGRGR
jgi:hypothetical protein